MYCVFVLDFNLAIVLMCVYRIFLPSADRINSQPRTAAEFW